jgi:ComF family protein
VLDSQYPCKCCATGIKAYGRYEPPLSTLLKRYKLGSEKDLSKVLAPLYQTMLGKLGKIALIPVPASKKGFQDRGFDQMALLCKVLHRQHGYPVVQALKAKGRGEQKFLSFEQRKLREGYGLARKKNRVLKRLHKEGYSFVLIDDISTTGRTLEQCRGLLDSSYAIQSLAIVLALA